MVHGFWETGRDAVFNVRITDADAPSNRNRSLGAILRDHCNRKKAQYLHACLQNRRHFTPLVFTVDGKMAPETAKAARHLSDRLAGKWEAHPSQISHYVKSRLALSLVRMTTYCLHGSRAPSAYRGLPRISCNAALQLYR